jgi:osmoprotectant transport system permease protein
MGAFGQLWRWLLDAGNWSGSAGIPVRVLEHVQMSLLAVVGAAAIALPVGLFIGHTRRLEFVTVTAANLGRAIPSFAIVALTFPIAVQLGWGLGFWPTLIALFLLALPPIITNTYVGVRDVDRDAVEAARGMGMTERDVLLSIELPLAAPLIVAGIRTSAVQVVATATLGALVAWGGLGRFIIDGFAQQNDGMLLGGAVLVAALAIATEVGLGVVERMVAPTSRTRKVRFAERFKELSPRARPGGDAL